MAERKQESGTLSADGDAGSVVGRGKLTYHFNTTNRDAANGTFGGGTVTLYKKVQGIWCPALDSSGNAIALTAEGDGVLEFGDGMVSEVIATLAGATSPTIYWRLAFDRG